MEIVQRSRKPTGKKVLEALEKQGRKKTWLAKELDMSRPILDARIEDNCWSVKEIIKLHTLLGID